MGKVKVGLVGCGYWGEKLARNLNQLGNIDLVYCCDLDEKILSKIKNIYPYVQTTRDYNDLLNDPELQAIVVATEISTHYEITKQALEKSKHVLIEKPMTSDSKHAEELIKLAKSKNLLINVDHTFEFMPAIRKIKEIISSGELGNVYYIRANWLNLGLLQPDVNVVWDLAAHIFAVVLYLFNENPLSVSANGNYFVRNSKEEFAVVVLKFPNNKLVNINISWLEPRKIRELVIVGSKKMLVFDLINYTEQIKLYEGGVDIYTDDANKELMNYRTGNIYSPNLKNLEPLSISCSDFANMILKSNFNENNMERGYTVVKILEAADKSLAEGGEEVKL